MWLVTLADYLFEQDGLYSDCISYENIKWFIV